MTDKYIDLDAAVREAEDGLVGDSQQEEGKRRRRTRSLQLPTPLLMMLLVLVPVIVASGIWINESTLSASQIESDLFHLIDRAESSVEKARKASGELPPIIPDAALSAVVAYKPRGDVYTLEASISGLRVRLEEDGAVRIFEDD